MVEDLERLLETSRIISWRNFGKKISFYVPSFTHYKNIRFHSPPSSFPSISITGKACALKCKHCEGRVLETMISATTPEELVAVCRSIKEKGGRGCLISGGCLPDGSVPLQGFIEAIRKVKEELGLTLVVHTGVIDEGVARMLADAKIDAALIDILGSQETIEEVYNLDVGVEDYEASLKALHDSGVPFVPHVVVGLHYGKLLGEGRALEMISRNRPHGIVVIALMPLRGTPMEGVRPPREEDVAWVLAKARIMMPDTPIALGCMRPKGSHRRKTDLLAVRGGVNAIAFPAEEAIDLAESMSLKMTFSPVCCSQIYKDF